MTKPPSDRLLHAHASRDLMMLISIKESPSELALGAVLAATCRRWVGQGGGVTTRTGRGAFGSPSSYSKVMWYSMTAKTLPCRLGLADWAVRSGDLTSSARAQNHDQSSGTASFPRSSR